MINLLIPIAGDARRFVEQGIDTPKPAILVGDKTILQRALDSLIIPDDCKLHFVVRREHDLEEWLRDQYGDDINVIVLDQKTDGTLETCLKAADYINTGAPLFVYTPDVCHERVNLLKIVDSDDDGKILVFKANSPSHSYVKLKGDLAIETAEKKVISPWAAVGLYYFKTGRDFVQYAQEMMNENIRTNGEFYLCPMYNLMIRDGRTISVKVIETMHVLGTPDDVAFYEQFVLERPRSFVMCADHSGYETKQKAKLSLALLGYDVVDVGTHLPIACDHHDFLKLAFDFPDRILLCFCETGQAFNMAANKMYGRRSALVFDEFSARRAVEHNAANAFCIPSSVTKEKGLLQKVLHAIIDSKFQGGRHTTRIMKFLRDDNFYV